MTPRQAMSCPEVRVSLGVYVLGAIDPAERSLVDAHLSTCRDCRDELAGLASLPALLSRVSPSEAVALAADGGPNPGIGYPGPGGTPEPPPELLGTVLSLTAARRRRRRWRDAALGLAAALVIAAGVFGGLSLRGSGSAPLPGTGDPGTAAGPWHSATGDAGGMAATVDYRPMGWGTQLSTVVSGIPAGTDCELYVIAADGHRVFAGSWKTDKDEGSVWYPSSASVSGPDVTGFQLTVGHGRSIAIHT